MNRKLIFALQIVLVALAGAVIMSNSRGAGAALPISGPGFYAHVRSGQEAPQAPVGTGFTYQGSLKNGGNPANGQFDFQFKLYDALSGGGQVGSTLTVGNQTVTGGLFTVQLDFGAAAFQGDARWLEIAVRTAGGGTYTTLAPRQPLTATPYAASLMPGAAIIGTLPGPALAVTNTNTIGVQGTGGISSYGVRGYGGIGVYGITTVHNGVGARGDSLEGYGLHGYSGGSGIGVRGEGSSQHGGLFTNNSTTGYAALQGIASGDPGYGIYGEGGSVGVWGSTPNGTGVRGTSTNGTGVRGTSTNGGGMWGTTSATNGYSGVLGTAPAGSYGVRGEGGTGVYGVTVDGFGVGVRGASQNGYGVYGVTSGPGTGVRGETGSGWGVHGLSSSSLGVRGESSSGYGVHGSTNNSTGLSGVLGTAPAGSYGVRGDGGTGVYGTTSVNNGVGVRGESPGGYGIHGWSSNGWAGWFDGNVNVTGGCCEAAAGTFKIDHPIDPQNKYLVQSAVQSADMMGIYSGNVTTNARGEAIVTLPDWFEALNKDFRYQLTVMGQFAQAIVAEEIKANHFTIKSDKPGVKVSWQVTGIRKDPYAQAHPVVPEVDKPANEQGKYRHPAEWGQPESKGIGYEERQRMKNERLAPADPRP